jgi:hypothetical protein
MIHPRLPKLRRQALRKSQPAEGDLPRRVPIQKAGYRPGRTGASLRQDRIQDKDFHRSTSGNELPGGEVLRRACLRGARLFDWQLEGGTYVPYYAMEARLLIQ